MISFTSADLYCNELDILLRDLAFERGELHFFPDVYPLHKKQLKIIRKHQKSCSQCVHVRAWKDCKCTLFRGNLGFHKDCKVEVHKRIFEETGHMDCGCKKLEGEWGLFADCTKKEHINFEL